MKKSATFLGVVLFVVSTASADNKKEIERA